MGTGVGTLLPYALQVCEGSEGIIGCLPIKRLHDLGTERPELGRKVMRCVAALALGSDFDPTSGRAVEPGSSVGGGAAAGSRRRASVGGMPAPAAALEGEEGEVGGGKATRKTLEIVFQRQLRRQEEQRANLQGSVEAMVRAAARALPHAAGRLPDPARQVIVRSTLACL